MSRENIKELIKLEYENGATMVFLSNKYNVSVGTIKTWSFTQKWIKKNPNIKTKTNKKTNQQNQKKNNKDIKIKQDILNDLPLQEIMARNGVSERTVQRKGQSIRELIKNRNTTLLENVSNKLIANKQEKLEEIKETKLNLIASINEAIAKREIQAVKSLNELLALIIKAEKELYRELRLKVTYEETEFEKQLAEEEIQRNRLEIEKLKQGTEEDKKVEIKIIGVD